MVFTIPYIILIFIFAVLSLMYHGADKEKMSNIRIVCVIVFVLFFGLRGFVGDDWINYYTGFDKVSLSNISDIYSSFDETVYEPGFIILMLVCKSIFNNYFFFVFVCTCINVVLLLSFFRKYTDNVPLAFLLFVCMGGLVIEINLLRNAISICIFINSIQYIKRKNFWLFLLMNILGATFHLSSFLFIPLYFILNRNYTKWTFLAIVVICNAFFLLHIKWIMPIMLAIASRFGEFYADALESYTEGKYAEMETGLSIGYLERLFTGLLLFCYYDKLTKLRRENVVFLNSFLVFYLFFFMLSEFSILAGRLANLFSFSYWILWGDMIKCFSIRNNKILFVVFLSVYCLLKTVGSTNIESFMYDNVLTGVKSYDDRRYIHRQFEDTDD